MTAPVSDAEVVRLREVWLAVTGLVLSAIMVEVTDDDEEWDARAKLYDATAQACEDGMSELERLTLLGVVIRACQFPEADDLMDAAVRDRRPMPAPAFGPIRSCADAWAAFSSKAEIKAYLLAAFNRLPKLDRVRFLAAAQKKE